MADLLILSSARKRQIPDEDIRHAIDNNIDFFDEQGDLELDMYIGPARDGTMLEVGVELADTGLMVVWHVMKRRDKYVRQKPGR